MKRLIICADGTWNRPEQLNKKQYPTNVLKLARNIAGRDDQHIEQIVFYDWGIGSYHDQSTAGAFGIGLEKNIMDGYRFLVHNYVPGDEIYVFGFSRGAYTVRSLTALINNAGILKSTEGKRVAEAFALYKNKRARPQSEQARDFRDKYCIEAHSRVKFVGVWDTVGALGLPFTIFGLIKDKHLFFDQKLGGNIDTVRHALALDELRKDFAPTIWQQRQGVDLQQVWFAGCHSDIGGSYAPDKNAESISDIAYNWMCKEANKVGLQFCNDLSDSQLSASPHMHNEYKGKFKLLGKHQRLIPADNPSAQFVHSSVKRRAEAGYQNHAIDAYIQVHEQWPPIVD